MSSNLQYFLMFLSLFISLDTKESFNNVHEAEVYLPESQTSIIELFS